MNKVIAGAALSAVVLCLSACGWKKDGADTIDKAEGEILERSVSDDMLPYDRLKSQPPLVQPEEGASSGAAQPDDAASGAPSAEPPRPVAAAAPAL